MIKKEKCRDEKGALGFSKIMVNIGVARENLVCKLYSNYESYRQEIKKLVYVLQTFHESLGEASK